MSRIKLALVSLAGTMAFLALAILGAGGFAAFFSRPPLIALAVATVVMTGAATICAAIALGAPAFYTTNGLFLAIVLAEVAQNTSQVVSFRRGA